jgi:hydroxymethylpyrimidine pyrophosphatase-like HAD family hydrolase
MANDPEHLGQALALFEERFSHPIVVCEEKDYNRPLQEGERPLRYCLDILAVAKNAALEYVAKRVGAQIKFTAGDSGNDLNLLMSGDINSIVGGATRELYTRIQHLLADLPTIKHIKEYQIKHNPQTNQYFYIGHGSKIVSDSVLEAFEITHRMGLWR